MIYKAQFTSRDDTIYVVEIDSSKVDGLDTKKEIKLGVPPFTVKYEGDEDLNKPIRMSEATINVLTTDTPWDLVTNKATDVSVKLFKTCLLRVFLYESSNAYFLYILLLISVLLKGVAI